jgi:hypothetical protein
MAQMVELLTSKHKDPSTNPSIAKNLSKEKSRSQLVGEHLLFIRHCTLVHTDV